MDRKPDPQAPELSRPVRRTVGIVEVRFGIDVQVVEPVNLYGCTVGDDCFVGPFVEIQQGAVIGARTRIQSHAFICEKVVIGTDCFVSHGVMFVNDRFRDGGPTRDPRSWEPTQIGDRVSLGTGATILPVTICDDTVVGAGAVVTSDIERSGFYVGNPARFLRSLGSGE